MEKNTELQEIECKEVDWIQVYQNGDQK